MLITSLERQPRRRRVNLFVDGRFVLSLALSFAQEKGLHPGMTVDDDTLAQLRTDDERHAAYEAAIHLLSYRPRSKREMRQRLRRRSISPDVIDETVARLHASHYLDDAAFAQFWRESRQSLSPRSGRLIRSELLSKGVDVETATGAVEGLDDEDSAYRAAAKRLKSIQDDDFDTFRRRLGGFLTRRGFSYDVIRRVVDRCWRDSGGSESS
jgi:regulatory protein